MTELKNELLTNKYTHVFHEDPCEMEHGAPHHFVVTNKEGDVLTNVDFQCGPIHEAGVNGCCNEDLIAMVIARLVHFQDSPYACRENHEAITKLEEALLWLRKRTLRREMRGVEGTHIV